MTLNNKLMMNKYLVFTKLILLMVLYIIINMIFSKNGAIDDFRQFNSHNINGELEDVSIAHHGVKFKLKKDTMEYFFHPYINLKEDKIFNRFAEKGDVILKPAYSDTLKLIKKQKVYLYSFLKFSNEKK